MLPLSFSVLLSVSSRNVSLGSVNALNASSYALLSARGICLLAISPSFSSLFSFFLLTSFFSALLYFFSVLLYSSVLSSPLLPASSSILSYRLSSLLSSLFSFLLTSPLVSASLNDLPLHSSSLFICLFVCFSR